MSTLRGVVARTAGPLTLLAAALLVLAVLLLDALAAGGDPAPAPGARGPAGGVPRAVSASGSLLVPAGPTTSPLRYPDRTVALTFDGGPDPQWTPRVLEVLRRHGVPGTFFVAGSQAVAHPDLVRDVRAQGSQVALTSYTAADPLRIGAARTRLEVRWTQLAVAAATGEVSDVVRTPGSPTPAALDDARWGAVQGLGSAGWTTALADLDSHDAQHPGVAAIVASATPTSDRGVALLMHDGGGDRSQTVAALDRLIPALEADGWSFTTVGAALGRPDAVPAGRADVVLGTALASGVRASDAAVRLLQRTLFVVGLVMVVRLVVTLLVAERHARRSRSRRRSPGAVGGLPHPGYGEPVTVVVPAYNEKECIEATLTSLLASDHPIEVVVVDDGSSDGTGDIVEALALPGVRLVRQPNGGKPSALNTGTAAASHEVVVMLDGDTVFEPSTVGRLVQAFADPRVGAVAGNAKVANRSGLVTRWQHIEYVMGFNIDRRVQDVWRCMATVPGAVGAYRRVALVEAGGVSDDTLAEDTDLTMALCRAGWRVVYEDSARAWTEAPATFHQLWLQRYRWAYGTLQAMWKHRRAVVERGASGRFGRVGLLQLAVFGALLPLLAPLADVFLL